MQVDQRLVGTWKNTEVLGAGSEISFSTETFIRFSEDGEMKIWTGQSAGAGTSFESNEGNAGIGTWYTSANSLHMIDAQTGQDAVTYFAIHEDILMLHAGGAEKKIFRRI